MNVSGILVTVRLERLEPGLVALAALPGVDVHQHDAGTGRVVVTQEAGSVGEEVEGLKRIQALPDVLLAELVYHRFDEDPELDRLPSKPVSATGEE